LRLLAAYRSPKAILSGKPTLICLGG